MKIVIYENSHGLAHYTYQLCNALQLFDINNDIFYITNSENKYLSLINKEIKILKSLKSYKETSRKHSLYWIINRLFISLSNILKRNNIIKKMRPDVLSIQSTIPILDKYFLTFIKKFTYIVLTVHDVIPPEKSYNWNLISLKKMYQKADRLIVHTDANKQQLCDIFNIPSTKVSVIRMGVDTTINNLDVNYCKTRIGITNNKYSVLFYGSIRQQKGLNVLIMALKNLDYNLIIAGSMPFGEKFDKYNNLIKENKINCIKYIEYVSEELTEVLFQACDIVVLPYIYFYSQSGVFMKAIQYQKPVITTNVGGFKEYIDKYRFGEICIPNNIEDLQNNIQKVLNNLSFYNYNAANVSFNNSWEKSAKEHLDLFKINLERQNNNGY
jgi:Glycosyltransferase